MRALHQAHDAEEQAGDDADGAAAPRPGRPARGPAGEMEEKRAVEDGNRAASARERSGARRFFDMLSIMGRHGSRCRVDKTLRDCERSPCARASGGGIAPHRLAHGWVPGVTKA